MAERAGRARGPGSRPRGRRPLLTISRAPERAARTRTAAVDCTRRRARPRIAGRDPCDEAGQSQHAAGPSRRVRPGSQGARRTRAAACSPRRAPRGSRSRSSGGLGAEVQLEAVVEPAQERAHRGNQQVDRRRREPGRRTPGGSEDRALGGEQPVGDQRGGLVIVIRGARELLAAAAVQVDFQGPAGRLEGALCPEGEPWPPRWCAIRTRCTGTMHNNVVFRTPSRRPASRSCASTSAASAGARDSTTARVGRTGPARRPRPPRGGPTRAPLWAGGFSFGARTSSRVATRTRASSAAPRRPPRPRVLLPLAPGRPSAHARAHGRRGRVRDGRRAPRAVPRTPDPRDGGRGPQRGPLLHRAARRAAAPRHPGRARPPDWPTTRPDLPPPWLPILQLLVL